MDDDDIDPHVSMSCGIKFKSSCHMSQYTYNFKISLDICQSMYPNRSIIVLDGYKSFHTGRGGK